MPAFARVGRDVIGTARRFGQNIFGLSEAADVEIVQFGDDIAGGLTPDGDARHCVERRYRARVVQPWTRPAQLRAIARGSESFIFHHCACREGRVRVSWSTWKIVPSF